MKQTSQVNSQGVFAQGFFLADGGLETTMIFHHGYELPHLAAFELLQSEHGRKLLEEYHERYFNISVNHGLTYIFETPTWRASPDWAFRLGYTLEELQRILVDAVTFTRQVMRNKAGDRPALLSGCIGPRGDGYQPAFRMSVEEAAGYHANQIAVFAETRVDLVTALTLNYMDEATGIAVACKNTGLPVVISFTLETDGKLPGGESLKEAITGVDRLSGHYPAHYMINCAHPSHFNSVLRETGDWKTRIGGIRANASAKSHAELDNSTELDAGDKAALAMEYHSLMEILPNLRVVGGCCGTDHTHLQQVCEQIF
jgi:S-methylmethionine-dependent homocysteine/selenocysteine methylase